MNSFTKKATFLALFLMVSIASFAVPADPEPTPDPPAPIDSNLYILLFCGIAFMVYFFAKKKYNKV